MPSLEFWLYFSENRNQNGSNVYAVSLKVNNIQATAKQYKSANFQKFKLEFLDLFSRFFYQL